MRLQPVAQRQQTLRRSFGTPPRAPRLPPRQARARTPSRTPCAHQARPGAQRSPPSPASSVDRPRSPLAGSLDYQSILKYVLKAPGRGSGKGSHARLQAGSQAPRESRRRRTARGSSTTQQRQASAATPISSAAGGHPGHPDFKVNLQARDQGPSATQESLLSRTTSRPRPPGARSLLHAPG